MKRIVLSLAGATAVVALGMAVNAAQPDAARKLKPASEFGGIADTKERSLALFAEAGKVIQHPRCVNCHPATNRGYHRSPPGPVLTAVHSNHPRS